MHFSTSSNESFHNERIKMQKKILGNFVVASLVMTLMCYYNTSNSSNNDDEMNNTMIGDPLSYAIERTKEPSTACGKCMGAVFCLALIGVGIAAAAGAFKSAPYDPFPENPTCNANQTGFCYSKTNLDPDVFGSCKMPYSYSRVETNPFCPTSNATLWDEICGSLPLNQCASMNQFIPDCPDVSPCCCDRPPTVSSKVQKKLEQAAIKREKQPKASKKQLRKN